MKLYWRYKKDGKWKWKAATKKAYTMQDGVVCSIVEEEE